MSEGPLRTPNVQVIQHDHQPVATAVSREDPVGRAQGAGFVARVRFVPQAAIAGINTNTRRLDVVNRGQAGLGNTVIATLQFNAGINGVAFDELALPVNDANDAVADGDVISLLSAAVGTGLADPGGRLIVEIERQD